MIVSDHFVFINFPKTGSQFVRKVLSCIHGWGLGIQQNGYVHCNFERIWLPNIRIDKGDELPPDEHGVCSQIPPLFSDKPVFSVKRNLFDWWVSLYEFGRWKEHFFLPKEQIRTIFPKFPDLTFDEFVRFFYVQQPLELHPSIQGRLPLGPASANFILFYCKNPFQIFNRLILDGSDFDTIKNNLYDVRFLTTENLNTDLWDMLLEFGYLRDGVEFILQKERVNISRKKERSFDAYYSEELKEMIMQKEQLLYQIFGAYEV